MGFLEGTHKYSQHNNAYNQHNTWNLYFFIFWLRCYFIKIIYL